MLEKKDGMFGAYRAFWYRSSAAGRLSGRCERRLRLPHAAATRVVAGVAATFAEKKTHHRCQNGSVKQKIAGGRLAYAHKS